jgi:uncharacterized membrane protein YeaQ/YmgE (transglycosylase-associated protein family)
MSYLIVVVIGAAAGWAAGQYLKGSEQGVGIDLAAGAAGAIVTVFLARVVGPAGASGYLISGIVALLGAIASLYAMRQVIKAKTVPAPRARRRR